MTKQKTKKKKQLPIKILVWGDSPAVATGFATVTRNIFARMAKSDKYQIDVIGINDLGGWKDPEVYGKNMRIYPAVTRSVTDVFGRPRLINSVLMRDSEIAPPWDIIWTLQDPFILEETFNKWGTGTMNMLNDITDGFKKDFPPAWWSKTISYWPIDSEIKQTWYKGAISKTDYPVAYTEYGKQEIEKVEKQLGGSQLKSPLKVLYHGVDTKTFYPMPDDERKEFREHFFQGRVKPDTFVCMVVARNQPRKDLPRLMKVFKEFQKKRPDSFLYLHSRNDDVGGTLAEFGNALGLKETVDYGFPTKFSENSGYPLETLNKIYNSADCLISTTLGEGFGLPYVEAMATKTINIAPDNTTTPELFNIEKGADVERYKDESYTSKIRGIAAKSGSNSSEFYCLGGHDRERYRPLTNIDDMVQKMIWAYDNPAKVKEIEDRAHKWVQQYDWDIISKEWEDMILKAFDDLQKERAAWKPPKGYKEGDLPKKVKIQVGGEGD